MKTRLTGRNALALSLLAAAALLGGGTGALLGTCGPFTDVAADAFCPFVLEIFTMGITTGTTATTYDPTSSVSRLQMAAFLSRTVDGTLKRGSRRAALNRFWATQSYSHLGFVDVGSNPRLLASDGADVWVASSTDGTVSRVRGSDGKLLDTWVGIPGVYGVVTGGGKIYVSTRTSPGNLYSLDPTQTAGLPTLITSSLGNLPTGLALDGNRLWTANATGSVSYVTPLGPPPWTTTTVTAGFASPAGILYDGSSVWVTDSGNATLRKLNSAGAILQTVTVGQQPNFPIYDGANIWVPNSGDSTVSVVRASNGAVLATLTGNGLGGAASAAFDGERVLVTNFSQSVSLWKAADLSPLGFLSIPGTNPFGVCNDGVSFWVSLGSTSQIARF